MNTIPNPTHGVQPTAIDLLRKLNGPHRMFVTTFKPEGSAPTTVMLDVKDVPEWIQAHSGKVNCYLSAAMPKPEAGTKAKFLKTDMSATNALWVDCDPEGGDRFEPSRAEILGGMRMHQPPPSCIVDTGNGYQAWWFLKATYCFDGEASVAAFERRNKQLADSERGDSCFSIDHVMRMPDCYNVLTPKKLNEKHYPPGDRMARIVDWNPERTYDLEQFPEAEPEKAAAADIKLDRAKVAEQDISWLKDLPIGFSPKGRIIIEHEGTLPDLCDALADAGMPLAKRYSTWNSVTLALAAILKGCGDLSLEMMAAVLMAELPCNKHIASQKDKFRAVERALNNSFAPSDLAAVQKNWPDGVNTETLVPVKGYANTLVAITRLGVDCYYDAFRGKEFVNTHHIRELVGEISTPGITMLRHNIRKRFEFYPEKSVTEEAVTVACRSRMINPVTDYFDGLPRWDITKGTPLLDKMLHVYMGADDTPLNAAIGRKLMCAIVRRAKHPGCKWDYEPLLQGPQGIRKSMFCEDLAVFPDLYTDSGVLTGSIKEQMEIMGGKQIIEIAEMAGFSQSTREKNKAFRTRKVDRARMAYDRYAADQPRASVNISTTNEKGVLSDSTGERRYWLVLVRLYLREAFLRDKDALYAEAVAAEPTENLWLDNPELEAAHAVSVAEAKVANDLVDVLANIEGTVFGDEERISIAAVREILGLNVPDVAKDSRLAGRIADAMAAPRMGEAERLNALLTNGCEHGQAGQRIPPANRCEGTRSPGR